MLRDGGQEMGMGVPVSVCLLVLTCSIIECFLPWLAGTRTNTAGQNTPCKSTSFNIISIRFISCTVQCNQCGICIFFFGNDFEIFLGWLCLCCGIIYHHKVCVHAVLARATVSLEVQCYIVNGGINCESHLSKKKIDESKIEIGVPKNNCNL